MFPVRRHIPAARSYRAHGSQSMLSSFQWFSTCPYSTAASGIIVIQFFCMFSPDSLKRRITATESPMISPPFSHMRAPQGAKTVTAERAAVTVIFFVLPAMRR